MPASNPSRCLYNYSSFIPFGQARSEPVLALSFQSRQIFEDSTLRHRPSTEAIICLIVMDWMANLTREGAQSIPGGGDEGNVAPMQGERKIDTEYAEVLCRSYRTLMMGRRSEIKEKDLELLKGPVNAYLLVSWSFVSFVRSPPRTDAARFRRSHSMQGTLLSPGRKRFCEFVEGVPFSRILSNLITTAVVLQPRHRHLAALPASRTSLCDSTI